MTMRAEDVIEVLDALAGAGVDVWIDGGWGVDALLEEQTRQHDDLDVVVHVDRVPRLVVALANLGFREIRTWPDSPEVIVLRADDDRRVDVHPVRFDAAGNGIQQIEGGREWTFPAAGFAGTGSIGGRPVTCLTPEVQVICHAGYELDEDDICDVQALHERFGVELLPAQRATSI
jgi:lincosamide nucleotidyltransferase A/C/D/E